MRSIPWPKRLAVLAVVLAAAAAGAVTFPPRALATGPADHVLYWNGVLRRTFRQIPGAPGSHTRAGALMHGAIYDAANSAYCAVATSQCLGQPYLVNVAATPGILPDAATAIDYAAYTTLNSLRSVYPSLSFDADLATAQSGIPASSSRDEGQRVGTAAGQAMVNARTGDGFPDTSTYTASTAPGYWRPTGSGPAGLPSWGLVHPFALTSGSQFRPVGPAGYSSITALLPSSQYAANVTEVQSLGSATSTTRTADQTQAAYFWANDLDGTYKPPGQLFALTETVSQRARLGQGANARLFALVGIAMADAAIAAWDAKYLTPVDLWRPETAIHLADTDGNAATSPDTGWVPLSNDANGVHFSPPFPAYISGHATLAGAWSSAMSTFFGLDDFNFTGATEDPHAVGVTRTFTTFSGAAQEDALSRIWLGVHYRFDSDDGLATGASVASYAAANRVQPPTAYGFTGFYKDTTFIGTAYTAISGPVSIGLEFGLSANGSPITDLGAVAGYWWDYLGSTGTLTFNAATGRFHLPISTQKFCQHEVFHVLLRDDTLHTLTVDCEAV